MIIFQSDKWLLRFALLSLSIYMEKSICYGHLADLSDKTNDLIGYCAPYHGKVCKSYVSYSQVWYSNVCCYIESKMFLMSNE